MKFERNKSITDRKEWKKITSKPAPDIVNKIWGESEKTLKPCEVKFLANLVEYDQVDDIKCKFNIYHNSDQTQYKKNTLDNYIFRYGESIGEAKYREKNKICSVTLDNAIKKHGEIEGTKKFNELRERRKNPKKLMIQKYGYVEGMKRYNHFCERNKGNHSLERKFELYGEEEGLRRYNKFIDGARKRMSLGGSIEWYGGEIGREKYLERRNRTNYLVSSAGYKEKYGDNYREIMREAKDTLSLKSFIKRHGEEIGVIKYAEWCERSKYINSLQYYIDKYGEEDGNIRFIKRKTKTFGGKINYSKVSQELFDAIKHEGREKYATKNGEFLLIEKGGSCYFFDYVNIDRKKVVEFNGDCFHGNPEIFNPEDKPNPFNTEQTAKEMWEYDEKKNNLIKERGYDVMVVWEKDYRANKEKTIEKVNKFVYD